MRDVYLRPARPQDEEAVKALSAQIWEGQDYVADVFSEWLDDRQGQFAVAISDDTLVGFAKLTRMALHEWWLEGLRVHPEFRNQGIARRLHRHMVQVAVEIGTGSLRFATAATNEAVHQLAQETGFRQVNIYLAARYEVRGDEDPVRHLVRATEADLHSVQTWLDRSALYHELAGLYEESWQWQELEPQLPDLVMAGRVFRWQAPAEQAHGVVIVDREDDQRLRLSYFDVGESILQSTAQAVASLAAEWRLEKAFAKVPARDHFRAAFTAAGWEIEPDFQLVVFERDLHLS